MLNMEKKIVVICVNVAFAIVALLILQRSHDSIRRILLTAHSARVATNTEYISKSLAC